MRSNELGQIPHSMILKILDEYGPRGDVASVWFTARPRVHAATGTLIETAAGAGIQAATWARIETATRTSVETTTGASV